MLKPLTTSRLRKRLKKTSQPQTGWMDVSNYVVGKADGTILTGIDGMIYVRDPKNGQVLTAYNSIAPTDRPGLQVKVGRLVGESIYRVKGMRDSFGVPAGGGHSSRHSHDDLFIGRDRFLPFLVMPIKDGGFVVQIYGDVIEKADGTYGWVENQPLDLSSHVPTVGALYVLIEADDDGVIYVIDGTEVDAKELLTPANIPVKTTGRKASCAVRLYNGQTQLYRDPKSINDFRDVRSLTSGGGGAGGAVDSVNGQTGVVVLDPDDLDDSATTNKFTTWAEITKLAGIETGAEVNNISDANATDLTDGGETTLHSHTGGASSDGWIPYSAVVPTRISSALDGTFTVTIASPAVVTKTAHGLITGSKVSFGTTGALPTGLATGTDYWVMRIDANTFNLCASFTNAIAAGNGAAGVKINTSGTQSGVHSLAHYMDPVYRLRFTGVDLTSLLYEGMPIKLTQNSIVRYGWISSVPTFSSGNTDLYVLTRCDDASSDYDILDTSVNTISNFHYGLPKQPGLGFPIFEDYWKISLRDTTNATQASPAGNIYNLGNLAVILPVARWNTSFYVLAESSINLSGTQLRAVNAGLSDNIVTYSDMDLKDLSFLTIPASSNATIRSGISRSKTVSITTETTEYLLCNAAGTTGATSISFRADVIDTIIECVCDYLR